MGVKIDETLALAGSEGIERKRGRTVGAFDVLRLSYSLTDAQGPAAVYRTSVILPRREADV